MPADEEQDVPYTEDLQDLEGARAWVESADVKRPERAQMRTLIVARLRSLVPGARVLELGSGPGLLAEHALRECTKLGGYTLFDFSEPMLQMSRDRVGRFPSATFILDDFRREHWTSRVDGPYDAIVSMQAVHEVRHKRHVPHLYRQIHSVLAAAGLFLVADRLPLDDTRRSRSLFMTANEQLEALTDAGFKNVRQLTSSDALVLCEGTKL